MGFPKQEYRSGLPFLLQGLFLIQGLNQHLLHWQIPLSHQRSPCMYVEIAFSSKIENIFHFDFFAQRYILPSVSYSPIYFTSYLASIVYGPTVVSVYCYFKGPGCFNWAPSVKWDSWMIITVFYLFCVQLISVVRWSGTVLNTSWYSEITKRGCPVLPCVISWMWIWSSLTFKKEKTLSYCFLNWWPHWYKVQMHGDWIFEVYTKMS